MIFPKEVSRLAHSRVVGGELRIKGNTAQPRLHWATQTLTIRHMSPKVVPTLVTIAGIFTKEALPLGIYDDAGGGSLTHRTQPKLQAS